MIRRLAKGFARPHNGGYVLVGVLILIAAATGLLVTSLNRSKLSMQTSGKMLSATEREFLKEAIIQRVMMKIKTYHEQAGYSLATYIPTSAGEADADMMKYIAGASGNYKGVNWQLYIGDNYESAESPQNYYKDDDNNFLVKFEFTWPDNRKTETLIMITPGQPEVPATPGPTANIPAGANACFGRFNWLTTALIGNGDTITGFDKDPPNGSTCTTDTGCTPTHPNNQAGVSTSSILGLSITWSGGTLDGTSTWSQINNPDCTEFNHLVTLAKQKLQSGSGDVIFYENVPSCSFLSCSNTTTEVNGDVTLGTPDSPKVTIIKTSNDLRAILNSHVVFNDNVRGAGILVVQGNADFKKGFDYEGVVIVDAEGRLLGNSAEFKGDTNIFGSASINEANFAALIGTVAYQLDFDNSPSQKHYVIYSSEAMDNALSKLDPTYVPNSGQEAVPFQILAYQDLK